MCQFPLSFEGVSQLCFDFVAVHMDVSRWNSTNQFRPAKRGGYKKPNYDTASSGRGLG